MNDKATENENTKPSNIVAMPHGEQQQIKIEIVDMIHSGENPFDIIYHVAKWLEAESGEPGYAQYVEEQIHSIYGFALEHEKPIQDELNEVSARLKRIEKAYENPDFTDEEHTRIGFAINRHKKNIERLQTMLQKLQSNHANLKLKKN